MRSPSAAYLALFLMLAGATERVAAQLAETPRAHAVVSGTATITNNGISIIPSFTLGRPAAIVNLSIARRGLSFEPDLRMGLDGKPWAVVFWGRYKLVDGKRMHVQLGAHPAVAFRTVPATTPGGRDLIAVRRYAAGEVNSTYTVSPHVSVGAYYLGSYGIEHDAARHTHFIAARTTISRLQLSDRYTLRIAPQAYYLQVDHRHGTYINSSVTLARRGSPFSIGATVNETIRSTVVQKDDLLWNVSLTYEFH